MAPVARVAHFSDLHLLSLEGARLADFANKRWTGGVNLLLHRGRHYRSEVFDALVDDLNAQSIDHVACTGDVTNLALEGEFKFARGRFDRIAAGPERVTCVPGNHDNYVADVAGLFEQSFAPFCSADPEWRWPSGGRWPIVRVRGDLAVIGLSTSQPTAWFLGYGSLGDEQRERLRRVLSDGRLAGKFRLILMHHPAAGKWARRLHRGLHDHGELAAIVSRTGAELVVHGHEHLDLREELAGPDGARVPVRGIQSGSYIVDDERRRARYRIYTIEGGAGGRPRVVSEELRTWRPARQAFESEAVTDSASALAG